MSDDLLLVAGNVSKRYGGQWALRDVTFRVRRGAVNVLIGENGAGKSTLMRILAGVEQPDSGELRMDGQAITLRSPRDAAAQGIGIVHQELALMPNLDVAENIFAGRELVRAAMVDRAEENQRSGAALLQLRSRTQVRTPVADLPLGCRQVVELARIVAHGARMVILDEPTSALSAAETEALFAALADLKARGITVVYISHRLHELLHLGDWFTVLRGGRVVGEGARADVDRAWIVERMSGRPESDEVRPAPPRQAEVLGVSGLRVEASEETDAGRAPVEEVALSLGRGEIVGVYGLLGSGRTELLEALAGARAFTGQIRINGALVHPRNVREAMALGVVLVPEDRQRDGLVPELSVRENVALAAHGAWISREQECAAVRRVGERLNLRARDWELPVTTLSGGNQQKVLLARCLLRKPKVLLLDEPTRGVDVGAKAEIYRSLRALAAEGLSILFTSSEIEETRLLADRVLVLRSGRIAAEMPAAACTDEALFQLASPSAGPASLQEVAA